MKLGRRAFMGGAATTGLGLAADAAALSMAYAHEIEPQRFEFPHEILEYPDLPEALEDVTIVHLTDLHADVGSPLDMNEEDLQAHILKLKTALIKAGAQKEKTILVLTGDYISHNSDNPKDVKAFNRYLEALSELDGYFALKIYTEGNHEHRRPDTLPAVREALAQFDYQGLSTNDQIGNETLTFKGKVLGLVGLPDYLTQPAVYEGELVNLHLQSLADKSDFSLLLTHNMEGLDLASGAATIFKDKAALALAGHTHGGQTGIELVDRWGMKKLGYTSKLIEGLHQLGSTFLARVSRGLGLSQNFLVRFGSRPEIPILTLKRAA